MDGFRTPPQPPGRQLGFRAELAMAMGLLNVLEVLQVPLGAAASPPPDDTTMPTDVIGPRLSDARATMRCATSGTAHRERSNPVALPPPVT